MLKVWCLRRRWCSMEERQRQLSRPLPPQGRGRPTSPDLPPWRAGRQSEDQGGPFELPLGAGPPVARRPPPQVVFSPPTRLLQIGSLILDRARSSRRKKLNQAGEPRQRAGPPTGHQDGGCSRPSHLDPQHKVRRLLTFHLSSLLKALLRWDTCNNKF